MSSALREKQAMEGLGIEKKLKKEKEMNGQGQR